jgi:hypothetical protein
VRDVKGKLARHIVRDEHGCEEGSCEHFDECGSALCYVCLSEVRKKEKHVIYVKRNWTERRNG